MKERHPERSEGSPEYGFDLLILRSFATLRMTYLGCWEMGRCFFKMGKIIIQYV